MVEVRTAGEIDAMGAAGRVVADILAAARSVAGPGVTLKELDAAAREILDKAGARSEERRVGKECCLVCRSRWSPYH